MKTTRTFFILLFCMTSSLTASISQIAKGIVEKVKNALYNVESKEVWPIKKVLDAIPKEGGIILQYKTTYTPKHLNNDDITQVLKTLTTDIKNALTQERSQKVTQNIDVNQIAQVIEARVRPQIAQEVETALKQYKESLKTHTQFFKAYHAQHPYAVYAAGCLTALLIAHSAYVLINKMRKKDPQS
jgi:uncharacterized membrane protein YheB (UPF0754 family)